MAQAGYPRSIAGDSPLEGLYLAGVAARRAGFEAVVEAVDALCGHEVFQRFRVRIHHAQVALVARLHLAHQLIGLLGEATRVDGEYVYCRQVGPDDVREDDRLGTEAARIDHPSVFLDGRREALTYGYRLLFELEV